MRKPKIFKVRTFADFSKIQDKIKEGDIIYALSDPQWDAELNTEIQKEDFITKPGEFPWKMHEDDYKRYQDALSKMKKQNEKHA